MSSSACDCVCHANSVCVQHPGSQRCHCQQLQGGLIGAIVVVQRPQEVLVNGVAFKPVGDGTGVRKRLLTLDVRAVKPGAMLVSADPFSKRLEELRRVARVVYGSSPELGEMLDACYVSTDAMRESVVRLLQLLASESCEVAFKPPAQAVVKDREAPDAGVCTLWYDPMNRSVCLGDWCGGMGDKVVLTVDTDARALRCTWRGDVLSTVLFDPEVHPLVFGVAAAGAVDDPHTELQLNTSGASDIVYFKLNGVLASVVDGTHVGQAVSRLLACASLLTTKDVRLLPWGFPAEDWLLQTSAAEASGVVTAFCSGATSELHKGSRVVLHVRRVGPDSVTEVSARWPGAESPITFSMMDMDLVAAGGGAGFMSLAHMLAHHSAGVPALPQGVHNTDTRLIPVPLPQDVCDAWTEAGTPCNFKVQYDVRADRQTFHVSRTGWLRPVIVVGPRSAPGGLTLNHVLNMAYVLDKLSSGKPSVVAEWCPDRQMYFAISLKKYLYVFSDFTINTLDLSTGAVTVTDPGVPKSRLTDELGAYEVPLLYKPSTADFTARTATVDLSAKPYCFWCNKEFSQGDKGAFIYHARQPLETTESNVDELDLLCAQCLAGDASKAMCKRCGAQAFGVHIRKCFTA